MAYGFTAATGSGLFLADSAALTLPNGDFTIAGWYRGDSLTHPFPYLIGYGNYATTDSFNVYIRNSDNTLFLNWRTGSETVASDVGLNTHTELEDGNWHHWCFCYNDTAGTLTCYLDGTQDGQATSLSITDTTDATTNSGRLTLGTRADAAAFRTINGDFADWAKVDRALTAGERAGLAAGKSWHHLSPAWHIPLIRAVQDGRGNGAATATGGAVAAHPRIYWPSAQILQFPAPAGGGTTVSGSLESISLSTFASTVGLDKTISGALESIQITENAASLSLDRVVSGALESITLSPSASTVSLDIDISAVLESLSLTTLGATVSLGSGVNAALESISVAPNQASVSLDVTMSGAPESITLTALQAAVSLGASVDAALESLELTTFGATLSLDVDVSATLEAIALTTYSAAIVSSGAALAQPGLEFTLPDGRVLYTLPGSKMHYTLPVSKIHFTFKEED